MVVPAGSSRTDIRKNNCFPRNRILLGDQTWSATFGPRGDATIRLAQYPVYALPVASGMFTAALDGKHHRLCSPPAMDGKHHRLY